MRNPPGIEQIDTTAPELRQVVTSPTGGEVITGQEVRITLDMSMTKLAAAYWPSNAILATWAAVAGGEHAPTVAIVRRVAEGGMGAKTNIGQIDMVARGKSSHSAGIGLRMIKCKESPCCRHQKRRSH